MKKILVIWDIILDKYSYWEVYKLNPEWPIPLLNVDIDDFRLWWSWNVAANIASLNWECDLIWIIWMDLDSDIFLEKCKEKNINFLWNRSGIKITVKHRFIDNSYKQQLLRVDYDCYSEPQKEDLKYITRIIRNNNYDVIVISDYKKWMITKKLIFELKRIHKKILVDSKSDKYGIFSNLFLLKPNFNEFIGIIWKNINNDDSDVERYWVQLVNKLKTNLIITRWNKGATLITIKWDVFHISPESVSVIDITWAWDTFIAVVAYFISLWNSLEESVIYWNKAASIVVWFHWTKIIDRKFLWEY